MTGLVSPVQAALRETSAWIMGAEAGEAVSAHTGTVLEGLRADSDVGESIILKYLEHCDRLLWM
jgi:hypothetical protein